MTPSPGPRPINVSLCPAPSLTVCQQEAAKGGTCAETNRAACASIFESAWTSSYAGAGSDKTEFLPDPDKNPPTYDNLLPGRWNPYDTSGIRVLASADPGYSVQKVPVKISGTSPTYLTFQQYFKPGWEFQDDGTAVTSCREYAYKRFWDYSQFQSDAAMCRRDPRCIYDAAITGPNRIAGRVLHERNHVTPLDHQIELFVGTRPKNVFAGVDPNLLWTYTTYVAGVAPDPVKAAKIAAIKDRLATLDRYKIGSGATIVPRHFNFALPTLDAAAVAVNVGDGIVPINGDLQLAQPPVESFTDEWQWHEAMHGRTTSVTDAEFQEFARRKTHVKELLDDWISLRTLILMGRIGPSDIAVESTRIQTHLADALITEYDLGANGCIYGAAFGCDWAPSEFVDRFANLYGPETDTAYSDCSELMGPKSFPGSKPYPPASARVDVPAYKAWSDAEKARLKAQFLALPTYPGTSLTDGVVGASRASNQSFGEPGLFTAGYDYNIGWYVKKIAQVSADDRTACAFAGQLDVKIHADANVLGANVASFVGTDHVVSSETTLAMSPDVAGGSAQITSRTQVFGYDVYEPVDTPAPSFHVAVDPATIETPHVSVTFVVVVVPVTFAAWAELSFGAAADAGGSATRTCPRTPDDRNFQPPRFGMNVDVHPWAYLDAVGTIAAGVDGFDVGVKGRLALLHVDAPITGGVNFAQNAALDPVLRFSTRGDLELTEMSGSFSLFAEALFLTYEKEIFAWDGYHQDLNLWNANSDVDLRAYNLVNVAP